MQLKFINIHSHATDPAPDVLTLRNIHQNERDQIFPENFDHCTVGLHPRFLENNRLASDFEWLEKAARLPQVAAIGEAGLDKIADVPMDLQEIVFQKQVEISEQLGKPMLLHCVRAHDRLLQLNRLLRPRQIWVFHGFDKHPNTARQVLDAGCFLSFGAAIFKENSHAAAVLAATPADRFFLENDDKTLKINAIYERAAAIRGIELDDLQLILQKNFQSTFTTKSAVCTTPSV